MMRNIDSSIAEQLVRSKVRTDLPQTVRNPAGRTDETGPARSFSDVLQEKMNGTVTFSKHAQKRINSRQIGMNEQEIDKLKEVIGKLENKGVKESLVLLQNRDREDFAFVVNVKNRTVITALTETMMKENIFTNIDSTVVLKS
jgi:flagellar operon protein